MSRAEWIESIVMLLCIPVLWPLVRSMRGGEPLPPYYNFVLIATALALICIAVRRIRRLRNAFRDQDRKSPPKFLF